MDAIVAVTAVVTIAALILSFVWVEDADAPMGDGMIIGCLVLAVPLWPITMPLWLLYLVKRHADQRRFR
jgi:hypothetical protein